MTLSDMLLHDTFDYRNSDLVVFDGISQTIDFFGTRLSRLLRNKLRDKRTSHEVIYFFGIQDRGAANYRDHVLIDLPSW